jgi:hypothetical protein
MSRSTRVFILCCLCVLGLSACVSFGRVVAHDALEFNKAYERQTNEEILLNILRASKLRPMKFTTLGPINGDISVRADSSITIPFGSNATTDVYSTNPSLQVTKSPQFTLTPSNRNQRFVRGIMSPIKASVLEYFISQGWAAQPLLMLFGERIELKVTEDVEAALCTTNEKPNGRCRCESGADGKQVCYRMYKNNPNPYELERLAADANGNICDPSASLNLTPNDKAALDAELCDFVRGINSVASAIQFTSSTAAVGPVFKLSGDTIIEQITKAADSRLSIKCLKAGRPNRCEGYRGSVQLYQSGSELTIPMNLYDLPANATEALRAFSESKQRTIRKDMEANLVLRSTEGVLFYLGEIADAQGGKGFRATVCLREENDATKIEVTGVERCGRADEHRRHLFLLRRALPIFEPGYFSVNYDGARYIIPEGDNEKSNSSVVLGLADVLLGLNTEASELAAPQNVRIIGGGS